MMEESAGSIISRKKRRDRSSLRVANESRFTWSSNFLVCGISERRLSLHNETQQHQHWHRRECHLCRVAGNTVLSHVSFP